LCAVTTATWPLIQTVKEQKANTKIQSAQEIIYKRVNKNHAKNNSINNIIQVKENFVK
jgi:hypothetical protein